MAVLGQSAIVIVDSNAQLLALQPAARLEMAEALFDEVAPVWEKNVHDAGVYEIEVAYWKSPLLLMGGVHRG